MCVFFFFFFSSRRRHTRCSRDWSSDVCSSDLVPQTGYNYNDTLSWTRGKHTFKFGGNVIRRQVNLFRPLTGKGYFFLSGNGNGGGGFSGGHVSTDYEVSDILAGFVDGYQHGPTLGMVGTRSWENGFFAQDDWRSEEHTSELQSRLHLVCRLLLEKKKKQIRRLEAVFGVSVTRT